MLFLVELFSISEIVILNGGKSLESPINALKTIIYYILLKLPEI